jgi:hypothetical protein
MAAEPPQEPQNMQDKQVMQETATPIVGGARIDKSGNHTRQAYFLDGVEGLKLENQYFDIPVVYNDSVKKWIHYFLELNMKRILLKKNRIKMQ